jgi:A/G-specific adenine glycosylase
MELGATLCLSASPRCQACPVQKPCASAFAVNELEKPKVSARSRDVHWQVNLHVDKAQGIWLMQRPDTGIWAGLWTPPIIELAAAPERTPCHIHQLTHRRLHLYTEASDKAPSGVGQWVADMSQLALPTGIHRLLAKCGVTI